MSDFPFHSLAFSSSRFSESKIPPLNLRGTSVTISLQSNMALCTTTLSTYCTVQCFSAAWSQFCGKNKPPVDML